MFNQINSIEELHAAYKEKRSKVLRLKKVNKMVNSSDLSSKLKGIQDAYAMRASEIVQANSPQE